MRWYQVCTALLLAPSAQVSVTGPTEAKHGGKKEPIYCLFQCSRSAGLQQNGARNLDLAWTPLDGETAEEREDYELLPNGSRQSVGTRTKHNRRHLYPSYT